MPVPSYGGVIFAGLAALGGAFEGNTARVEAPVVMSSGTEAQIQGIGALCTGARSAGETSGYTLQVAAVNRNGELLKNADVKITNAQGGQIHLQCQDEWLLLRAPVGAYIVTTDAGSGSVREDSVDVPAYGRVRVAVSFANS